ncbi:zinc finger BED domain-containing protein RICESLEEPER 2-like [Salvia miltiorrhiza]|uniref:zinc finger BED domain-containing protein RICESLEEPER 2-like n=1 Tax=Salvia miltiorrhiza TaxID=226208 RepID=UPI0025AD1518|nr:zinc finger BED domain-containing protein RICESLEEPER 2-like [Salvia miltiorrhiza]
MDELFEFYKKQVNPTHPPRVTSSASHSHVTSSASHRQRHPRSKRSRGSCASLTRQSVEQQEEDDISKLTIYLSEKQHVEDIGPENEGDDDDGMDTFDILQWWQNNSVRYPILSVMARDILAIPISTVASKSAFSMGGRVLDQFRSSLSPKMVEALICSSDWLRSSSLFMNDEEDVSETEQENEFGMVMSSLGSREVNAAASAPVQSCTGPSSSRA